MKIKQDFVTNSSSCSYIVCIPDSKKLIDQLKSEFKEEDIEQIRYCFYSEYIYFDNITFESFLKIHNKVDELGCVIMFLETGPDNEPIYYNIAYNPKHIEKIKKILN